MRRGGARLSGRTIRARSVTFRGFEAVAIEAMRELRLEKDAQIATLEARLARLEGRLSELEGR